MTEAGNQTLYDRLRRILNPLFGDVDVPEEMMLAEVEKLMTPKGVYFSPVEVAILRCSLQNSSPREDLIGALIRTVPMDRDGSPLLPGADRHYEEKDLISVADKLEFGASKP